MWRVGSARDGRCIAIIGWLASSPNTAAHHLFLAGIQPDQAVGPVLADDSRHSFHRIQHVETYFPARCGLPLLGYSTKPAISATASKIYWNGWAAVPCFRSVPRLLGGKLQSCLTTHFHMRDRLFNQAPALVPTPSLQGSGRVHPPHIGGSRCRV
jgi:hypothetical protein